MFYTFAGEASLDSRRRLPLASLKFKQPLGSRYRVEEWPDGIIRLIPVVSVTTQELEVLSNPKTMKRIKEGIEAAEKGDVVSFDPALALTELKVKRDQFTSQGNDEEDTTKT